MISTSNAVAVPVRGARRRSHRPSRTSLTVLGTRLLFIGVLLGVWQVAAGAPTSILPADIVGRPSSILSTFWSVIVNGTLFSNWGTTMERFLLGLVIAAPIGVVLGVVTSSRVGRWLFEPVITIAYAIPKLALITLYILILGIGPKSHIALVVSAGIFVYYFSTEQALREMDRGCLTAMRLMGASWFKIFYSFTVYSAIPHLLSATRIAVPLAFTTEIFAELRIPTSSGLGVLLSKYEEFVNGSGMMAMLLFVIVIVYVLDVITANLLVRYTRSIGAGVQL